MVLLTSRLQALVQDEPEEEPSPSMVGAGPWGPLEIVPVRIRLPDSMIPDRPLPIKPWVFRTGPAETRRILAEAGVEEALAAELMGTFENREGGRLNPSAEMIHALPPEVRARLYEVLRYIPGNDAQHSPNKFAADRMASRFSRLQPASRRLVEDLLYQRQSAPESYLLADLPALTWLVEDREERVRVVQAVSEQGSLMLRLRIDASSDAKALAAYWGHGGRRRDLEILINSLMNVDGGFGLDAIYLLPPFARSLLLTYPSHENAVRRDCFWTAVNFFLPAPDDRLDGPALRQILAREYRRVEGPLELGDVLVLWNAEGEAEHAAVYVAGGIYFTKNGGRFAIPWMLMPLGDLLELYDDALPSGLVHFRRVDLDD